MKIMFDAIDLTKYNGELEGILESIVNEIVKRETEFRKNHSISDIDSMKEIRYIILKSITILSQNMIAKTVHLIDDADKAIAHKVLGLKDDVAGK
jgi:hypothetical protein